MQPLVFKVTTKSEVAGDKHSKTLYKWQVLVEDSSASHTEILDTAMSVTFLLHPSFKRSKQVCRAAPYYINEVGWGAFQLKINIRFKDLKLQFDHFVHFEEQEYVVTLNVDQDATVKIDNLMTRNRKLDHVYQEIVKANPTQLCEFLRIVQKNIVQTGSLVEFDLNDLSNDTLDEAFNLVNPIQS